MKISKVKLIQGGVKGIEVHYLGTSVKDDVTFTDEHVVKYTAPVQKAMKEAFKKLKFHLLAFYRLGKDKYAGESTEITGVTSNGINFLISGKMKSIGNTTLALNTPNVTEDLDFPDHDTVIEVIDEIYAEVETYVEMDSAIDRKQLVIDYFNEKGEKQKVLDVDNLTQDQILDQAREILEKNGAIVMMEDDMEKSDRKETTSEEKWD